MTMSSTNETVARSPAPVDPRQRIEVVDMVRGFALFGVLLVNMFNFGAYSIVRDEPGDELALLGMQLFFETKVTGCFRPIAEIGHGIMNIIYYG